MNDEIDRLLNGILKRKNIAANWFSCNFSNEEKVYKYHCIICDNKIVNIGVRDFSSDHNEIINTHALIHIKEYKLTALM